MGSLKTFSTEGVRFLVHPRNTQNECAAFGEFTYNLALKLPSLKLVSAAPDELPGNDVDMGVHMQFGVLRDTVHFPLRIDAQCYGDAEDDNFRMIWPANPESDEDSEDDGGSDDDKTVSGLNEDTEDDA